MHTNALFACKFLFECFIFCYYDFTFVVLCVFVLKKNHLVEKNKGISSVNSSFDPWVYAIYMTVIFYPGQIIHASWSDIRKCNDITNLGFIFSYTLHVIINVLHCNVIEQVADFFYNITVKNITYKVYGIGKYESDVGDLIAFTNIRPKSMYDLSKIKKLLSYSLYSWIERWIYWWDSYTIIINLLRTSSYTAMESISDEALMKFSPSWRSKSKLLMTVNKIWKLKLKMNKWK
jgi:hypothetical protein